MPANSLFLMVGPGGIEPPTSTVSRGARKKYSLSLPSLFLLFYAVTAMCRGGDYRELLCFPDLY